MRTLNYCENPVQQAYNGGDSINARQLHHAHSIHEGNIREIESTINRLENSMVDMRGRIHACYDFISWVQTHAPDTAAAYKAHNAVKDAFDKADSHEGYAQAGPA